MSTFSPGGEASQVFDYGGLRIAVRTVDRATLSWLEEFLGPAFETVDDSRRDWTVTLDFDAATYDSLSSCSLDNTEAYIDGFTMDGSFRRFRVLQGPPQALLLDEKYAIYFEVDEAASRVRIIAANMGRTPRLALMRVVRELATVHSLCRGHVHVHGSAVAYRGRAFVLAGVKRSGKTSLLMHATQQRVARFISNDRVFLNCHDGSTFVRAMPTIFKIRPESLSLIPRFARRYRSLPYHFSDSLAESADLMNARRRELFQISAPRPRLNTTQFCDLMNVPATGVSPLGAIVFPRITHTSDTVIERLPPHVAARRLFEESMLKPSDQQRTAAAFRRPGEASVVTDAVTRDMCERIASQVPCYACAMGPTVYQRPFFFEELQRNVA